MIFKVIFYSKLLRVERIELFAVRMSFAVPAVYVSASCPVHCPLFSVDECFA